MRKLVFASALVFALGAAAPALAQRQPAPITFAGQGGAQPVMMASAPQALVGGDEDSYGYGGAPRAPSSAVIDIRRNAAPTPAQHSVPAPQPVAAEQGERPAWLEQERVGPPYQANGRWYVPTAEPGYEQTGVASWYGPQFHGQRTASGEVFDQEALTAAHPTLPIPSLVQVTNLENGREIIVRVNDRGPFIGERLIDLSRRSAEVLGFEQQGQAQVRVRYLGPAPRPMSAEGAAPVQPAPVAAGIAPQAGPMQLTREPAGEQYVEAPSAPPAPAYAAPAPVSGGYFVQIGAFSDLSNAHRVRETVSTAGPVNVDTRQTASGELFRVRMGPFLSREEAEAARMQVADLGYGEAVLAR
ncbi:MAG: septal ring lytic transglycosylase RlpA family protein [Hyphomonadaceae bacterium]|nr:septal ring lytic transglycosylase RlpA family protein [Hyphomonadaceae bacterium]